MAASWHVVVSNSATTKMALLCACTSSALLQLQSFSTDVTLQPEHQRAIHYRWQCKSRTDSVLLLLAATSDVCYNMSFLLEVNVLFYCMLLTRFSDWNFINDKFCQLYKLQCNWNSYSIHYKHVWWKYDTLYQVPKCVEIYAWSSKPGNQYVHCNQISTMPGSTINSLHCTWKADCTPHYLHSSWQWEKWSKQMLDVERGHEGSKLLEIDNRSLGCPKFCLSVQFSSCLCQLVHPSHFLFLCGISIALKKMVTFGMGPHSFSYYAVPSLSVTASSALQISRGLPHLCIVFSFQSQSTPPSCRRPSSWWNNALRDSFLLHSVLVAFGDQLVPVQIPHPACKKKRK